MTSQPFTPTIPPPAGSRRARPTVRELPADLLTPVAAFLRVRHRGPGLPAGVGRARPAGRALLVHGRRLRAARARRGERLRAAAQRARAPRRRRPRRDCRRSAAASSATSPTTPPARSSRPCRCRPRARATTRRSGASSSRRSSSRSTTCARRSRWWRSPATAGPPTSSAPTCSGPLPAGVEPVPALSGAGQSYPERTPADYEAMVRAAQVHIERGDVFQMVPSQLIARPTAASAFSLYRALRAVNPSPYMVFCDLGDRQIVSASPETHVSLSRDGRRDAQADRRHAPARRRRRRRRCARARARGRREGARRAPDARRPRAQRPRARLRAGQRARLEAARGRALLARHAPRLAGRRQRCATARTRSRCCRRRSRRAPSAARPRCARCS